MLSLRNKLQEIVLFVVVEFLLILNRKYNDDEFSRIQVPKGHSASVELIQF